MRTRFAPERTFHYSDTVRLNYEVQGNGPTPVVLLHGFAAALTTWDDIREMFPLQHFRLYLLDLKGFGFSSKPRDEDYRLIDQAAIVYSFLLKEDLRHTLLIGHSLGGGIALLVTLQSRAAGNHDLISRLILIDTAAYPQRFPKLFRLLQKPLLSKLLISLIPVRKIVTYNLNKVYLSPQNITPERIERYSRCFRGQGLVHALITTVRHLAATDYREITASYRQIDVPTLIIWGSQDCIVKSSIGRRLQNDIPGSRLVIINQSGHNPHEERAVETYAAIREFLAETAP